MIYINNTEHPNASVHVSPHTFNDQVTNVLIVTLPPTDHAEVAALLADATSITDRQERTITRYTVRMHYDTLKDAAHTHVWLLLDGYTTEDNPAYYQAQTRSAEVENTQLLNLLGEVAQSEYETAMEEIEHV